MEHGGPDCLRVLDLPEPQAGPGEVRIRVRAAAVNPTDTGLRSGRRPVTDPPPYVPGMDAAGVLDQIGQGVVTDLHLGDHVMAVVLPAGSRGAYSQFIAVPSDSVARAPAGATDAEAATLPMNGLTARLALDLLGLRPGETIAVTGAAGAVGGYVIQLAKADGLRVIADAAPADEELVTSLGAGTVVPRGPGTAREITRAAPGGVDALVDAALLNDQVVPAVRDGGAIATLRGFTAPSERGVTFRPVMVRDYARERGKLDRLRQQAEEGQITLRVARTLPAGQAALAHRLLEAGGTRGRIVLEF